jgi:hypothetical protein
MHKQARGFAIVSLALLSVMAACSQIPEPTTYPAEFQRKMVSVNHWSQFAKELEERIAPDLKAAGDDYVCVVEPRVTTPFNQAMQNYLLASFVRAGFRAGACGGTAPAIKIATQLIRYRGDRSSWPMGWVTAGLTLGAEIAGAATPPTKAELIVTTSLQRMGAVTHMDSDGFYVDEKDWRLYEPETVIAHTTPVAIADHSALTGPVVVQ